MINKNMNIKHFLGFHNPLICKETDEVKFEYQGAFDFFITKFTQYQCGCGRIFWMPAGSFQEWRLKEEIYQMTLSAVRELQKRGEYDKAIELLKFDD
ncbi:hypothetical protein A3F59_02645 [Candidatus Roizmanbacteria bacterium RIFCSPHIGHO2_12_FULL_38_13]|nr:MAG: hypothetical protein A3F59_02645 [Candidatus Roizmanbacteria bacterium RIFCSPHIGHO2_12_FULL_38_13]